MPMYRERANNSTTPYNSGRLKTETSSVEVVVRESESHALEVESLSRMHLIASGAQDASRPSVSKSQTSKHRMRNNAPKDCTMVSECRSKEPGVLPIKITATDDRTDSLHTHYKQPQLKSP